jgi:hypothetical protein
MANKSHIHKLKRHTYKNGEIVFFCVNDCSYKIKRELSLGKKCICWRCGEPFTMNEYSIRLAKPHCNDCTTHKGDITLTDEMKSVAADNPKDDVVSSLRDRLSAITQTGTDNDEDLL